jgi:hypothetical protein
MVAGFQSRYFELRLNETGSALLSYALAPPTEDEPLQIRGSIRVSEATVAVQSGSSRNFTVTAVGDGTLFARVRCGSEKERQEWITTLELAQGTKDGGTRVAQIRAAVSSNEGASTAADQVTPEPTEAGFSPDVDDPAWGSGQSRSPPYTPEDRARSRTLPRFSPGTPSALDSTSGETDTDDDIEGEHCEDVRLLITLHAALRKRSEALSAKVDSVADGGDGATLQFDSADFADTYCHMLGIGSDVVNKGISWNQRWNQRLRQSAVACDEMERQVVALQREVEGLRVAEAIASPD